MANEFSEKYQYLRSLDGTKQVSEKHGLSISLQPAGSLGSDSQEFVRVEVSGDGQEQEFLISPTEGVFREMWSDVNYPQVPTIVLLDGKVIEHPYIVVRGLGSRAFFSPLHTLGNPGERPYEERLKECLEKGTTLADRVRDFLIPSKEASTE